MEEKIKALLQFYGIKTDFEKRFIKDLIRLYNAQSKGR